MHRLHNLETLNTCHTATHSPGAVAASSLREEFTSSSSVSGDNEAMEKMEEEEEQEEERNFASMLPDPTELEGGMFPPEGWLRYLLPTNEDGDYASDEMVSRFLAEDHFGML